MKFRNYAIFLLNFMVAAVGFSVQLTLSISFPPSLGDNAIASLSWVESGPADPMRHLTNIIGFEIQQSETNDFAQAQTYEIPQRDQMDFDARHPKNKKYYFRVRAKQMFFRYTYPSYGAWSNTVSTGLTISEAAH